jgi:hypothetical protein
MCPEYISLLCRKFWACGKWLKLSHLKKLLDVIRNFKKQQNYLTNQVTVTSFTSISMSSVSETWVSCMQAWIWVCVHFRRYWTNIGKIWYRRYNKQQVAEFNFVSCMFHKAQIELYQFCQKINLVLWTVATWKKKSEGIQFYKFYLKYF